MNENRTNTNQAARGRWREILPALGIPTHFLSGKHQACPMCGGKDRARFDDRNKDGDYFCSQCGAGNGLLLLMRFHGWDFKRAANEVDGIIGNLPPTPPPGLYFRNSRVDIRTQLRRLYSASLPVLDDDPVGRYLAKRGLKGPWPKALRHVAEMYHKQAGHHCCGMLAVVSDATGKPITLHRTYLTEAGDKANVDPVRKFMPGALPNGGAIRLGEAAETMGIAEGIETALSAAALFNMPVWATTSELMLQRWQPPQIAMNVTIFADNDANFVGQRAAYTLAASLMRRQPKIDFVPRVVEVRMPPEKGTDWNDVLKAGN